MKKFFVILPVIVLMAILIGATPAFAQATSGRLSQGNHPTAHSYSSTPGLCSYCDGRDPLTFIGPHGVPCENDQAKPLQTINVTGGQVTLWWSGGCGTNWAETNENSTTYIADAHVIRADGHDQRTILAGYNDIWTLMVYAPNQTAQACGSINNWAGGCTGWW